MAYRRRNSLRAKGYAYGAGYYAVVILTAERQRFFGEIVGQTMQVSELGDVVLQMWSRIPELHPHVTLDEFQIMPDHFHGILVLDEKYHRMNGAGVGEGVAGVGEGVAGALSDALTRVGAVEGVIREKIALSDAQTGVGGDGSGVGEGVAGALSDALTSAEPAEGVIREKIALSDAQTGVGGDGSGVGEGEAGVGEDGAGALSDALTRVGAGEGGIQEKSAFSDVQTSGELEDTGVGEDGSGVGKDEAGEGEDGAGALSDALTSEQSRRARQFKAGSLSVIINSFKASVSSVAHRDFPHLPIKIWHRSFFDTIIRDEKHLNNMRQYIRNNVQQWQE